MGVMDHLRLGVRRAVTRIPPIRRILVQRDALLRENRELRGVAAPREAADAEERVIFRIERLMHRPFGELSAAPGISTGETVDDSRMVERVLKTYLATAGPSSVEPTAIWKAIFDTRQRPLHDLILGGDAEAVGAMLRRPGDSDLFWGFDGLVRDEVLRAKASPAIAMAVAKMCQDHLVRLAEVIGAVRMENPESLSGRPLAGLWPTDDLLSLIEKATGREVRFPNPFPDEIGVQTGAGVASYRAMHAIYQAWRIHGLLEGIPKPRVLELGGGLGRTAFYARQFGITDYTIIDLPFTGLAQGYFLCRTLGEDQVALQGEGGTGDPDKVKVLNPGSFLDGSDRFDLVLNVDSLTEMDRSTADLYLRRIQSATPLFLSINHERNPFSVKELLDDDRSRIAGVQRYPYGVRRGYVEELAHIRA
jgi:hypothetical protein